MRAPQSSLKHVARLVVAPGSKHRDIFTKDNLPLKIEELVVNDLKSMWYSSERECSVQILAHALDAPGFDVVEDAKSSDSIKSRNF